MTRNDDSSMIYYEFELSDKKKSLEGCANNECVTMEYVYVTHILCWKEQGVISEQIYGPFLVGLCLN